MLLVSQEILSHRLANRCFGGLISLWFQRSRVWECSRVHTFGQRLVSGAVWTLIVLSSEEVLDATDVSFKVLAALDIDSRRLHLLLARRGNLHVLSHDLRPDLHSLGLRRN